MKKKLLSALLVSMMVFSVLSPVATAAKNTVKNPSSLLAVVNKQNALPSWYVPKDLVYTRTPYVYNNNARTMRREAARALERMFNGAKKQGHTLYVRSGYRSYATQKQLFARYARKHGTAAANKFSARAGESEHQTGLVMDITSRSVGKQLVERFGRTSEGKWLARNAHKYGFILRYPKGRERETGYQYEPWHFRYVGVGPATTIYKNNWILEQYKKPVKKSASISTNKSSGQRAGNTIKIKAGSQGIKNPEYKFFINLGSSWSVLKNYSKDNSANWKPKKPGNYKLVVHVRERGTNKKYEAYKPMYFKVRPEAKKAKLSFYSMNGFYKNRKIVLTGGTPNIKNPEYRFHVNKGNDWTMIRDYKDNPRTGWYPKETGKYKLVVHVREKGSKKKYEAYDYGYVNIKNPPVKVDKVKRVSISSDPDKEAYVGRSIKLAARADKENAEYRFHLNKGSDWSVLRNYDDSNTVDWTPKEPGKYKLVVHSRTKGSKAKYEAYDYKYIEVKEKEDEKVEKVNITLEPKDSAEVNSTINISARADKENVEYRFHLNKGSDWSVLRNYEQGDNIDWTPKEAGRYKLVVHSRVKGSDAKYEAYDYDYIDITQAMIKEQENKEEPQNQEEQEEEKASEEVEKKEPVEDELNKEETRKENEEKETSEEEKIKEETMEKNQETQEEVDTKE